MRSLAKTATVALLLVTAGNAGAFEYPLQFAPGVDYQDLVVAGYEVAGKTIVGNCSFVQIVSGSGKDPKPTYVPVPETCTWSLFGALLGVAAGAPSVPAPVAVHGTQTIYARKSAHLYTGTDSALSEGGFVFTYGAHEDWLTPSGPMVLPQQPYSFTATLSSDGDTPLRVTRVTAHTAIAKGPDNPATKVKIDNTTCTGLIPAGGTCSVALTYTDAGLTAPSGLAYDTLTIHLTTNAGVVSDFVQHFTLEVKVTPNN